jgi:riboflavin biosynthesis pyrimidine reductase
LDLLDELRLHLAPVILGSGTPLWVDNAPRELRQIHVRASGHATHLTYRVA